jgi:RimJ/RimL family protein N-acetyltransferase
VIEGERMVLVPYKPEHVEVYHGWMQDPFLQEATASEPLSMEEERDMQQAWAEDPDKLTFIVLDRGAPDTPGTGQHGGAMAGDVNLFFGRNDDQPDRSNAEIDVMIAEPSSRRKGLAHEALQTMVAYSRAHFGTVHFVAKIKDNNDASMRLFQSLGFRETRRVAVFHEVHYELELPGAEWPPAEAGDVPALPAWLVAAVAALPSRIRSYVAGSKGARP